MPSVAPRVFISYSHDSPEHIDRVLAVADRLRGQGIDARLDQYEVSPLDGWQLWMEEQIESADFVLLVATETYERRRRGREDKGKGLGVRFEGAILSQMLYDNALHNETCIPVVFSGADQVHIPVILKSATYHDLSSEEGFEALYRHLTGQLAVEKPALGKLKKLPPRTRRQQFEPGPSYWDKESSELSEALEVAYQRHEELTSKGADLSEVNEEILKLRRRIREGGQLKPGDYLSDGRFRLLSLLGQGGFSNVFKAYDRQQRQLVAIKVLHGQYAEDRSCRERFFRGARKMAQLQHQGIVRVIEPGLEDGGYHFFVMELVAGGDLRQAVQRGLVTDLTPLRQIAGALDFAHLSGVVHRDVKPANILLSADGGAKLTDFDLVRAFDTTGGTRTGSMLGTFLYMAPEAMQQSKDLDAAADIYSLAMTAAFVLHGRELPPTMLRDPVSFFDQLEAAPATKRALARAASWDSRKRPSSAVRLIETLEARAISKGKPAKNEVKSLPKSVPSASLSDVQEGWRKRREMFTSVAESASDAQSALALADRLRQETRDGNDLYFLECAVEAVAEKWPEARLSAEQLCGRFYDHIPAPAKELFRWIKTWDGRVELWRPIPAGKFLMGSPDGERDSFDHERPQHQVVVQSPFRMAAVPVTVAQYAAFDPEHRAHHQGEVSDERIESRPVERVTWYQAYAFCRWLSIRVSGARGARLPSEEEWEFACRAGSVTRFWPGDRDFHLSGAGWVTDNSGFRTHRVGRKPANPWGLYDVHGNVWEWTSSEWRGTGYSGREAGIEIDPSAVAPAKVAAGSLCVFRGGSYGDSDESLSRSAYRAFGDPESRDRTRGFRVLLPEASGAS